MKVNERGGHRTCLGLYRTWKWALSDNEISGGSFDSKIFFKIRVSLDLFIFRVQCFFN